MDGVVHVEGWGQGLNSNTDHLTQHLHSPHNSWNPKNNLIQSVLHMGRFTVLLLKAESQSLLGTSQKRFWMTTDCKSSAKRPPSLKGKDEVFINIFFNFMCVYLYMHVHDCTCICRHVFAEARDTHQMTLPSRSILSIETQSPHDPVLHGCG